MNHIKTYKLYEGVYQDLKKELDITLNDYNSNIKRIKDKYLQDVEDCLVDITDNYEIVSPISFDDGDGVTFSDSILKPYLQVLVEYEEVDKFIIDFEESFGKCVSYLGKEIEVVNILIFQNDGHYRELYDRTSRIIRRVKSISDIDKVKKLEEGDKISISIRI